MTALIGRSKVMLLSLRPARAGMVGEGLVGTISLGRAQTLPSHGPRNGWGKYIM